MLQAFLCSYEDLLEEEINSGYGDEHDTYIRVIHNGKCIRLESDAMEPEDATFTRGLSWITDAIIEAYNLGIQYGKLIDPEHNPEQQIHTEHSSLPVSESSSHGEHSKLDEEELKVRHGVHFLAENLSDLFGS